MLYRELIAPIAAWSVFLVVLTGCMSESGTTVSGTIQLDNSPLDDATISFVPTSNQSPGWAMVQAGQYTIPVENGLGVGTFRVEIRAARTVGGKHSDPTLPDNSIEAVPARYNSRSELTVEIQPGKNEANFSLKTR